jgi:hypothetical protein
MITLSVIKLSVITLSVIKLSVIKLSVIPISNLSLTGVQPLRVTGLEKLHSPAGKRLARFILQYNS